MVTAIKFKKFGIVDVVKISVGNVRGLSLFGEGENGFRKVRSHTQFSFIINQLIRN